MSSKSDSLPGVVLRFRSMRTFGTPLGGVRVVVELDGEIGDADVWEEVQDILKKGWKIYTAADFKGEALKILREELDLLEKENHSLERKIMQLELDKECLQEGILPPGSVLR